MMGTASGKFDQTMMEERQTSEVVKEKRPEKEMNANSTAAVVNETNEIPVDSDHVTDCKHTPEDENDSDDSEALFEVAMKMTQANISSKLDREKTVIDHTKANPADTILFNELIDIVAQENSNAHGVIEHTNDTVDTDDDHECKSKTEKDNSETAHPDQLDKSPGAYEIGTIGYYIAIADNEAITEQGDLPQQNKKLQEQQAERHLAALRNIDIKTLEKPVELTPIETPEKRLEKLKNVYGSKPKLTVTTKRMSNRQTLVLTKIGHQYKYVVVPAYLPGQRVYKANSLVKNYAHRSAYQKANSKGVLVPSITGSFLWGEVSDGPLFYYFSSQTRLKPAKACRKESSVKHMLTVEMPRCRKNVSSQIHKKEIRKAKLLRKRNELRKGDPAKMAILRKKFVDQAKKYFGYPYAKKYWPPDSPEYKSKFFLDCCGLVRQVMRDLTYDFGFVLGPWNQAYMYDTLPKTVHREEDMKPGDLVFVSATYYNPKSKKQRHNMTHVEIWLGDGPKTIGARWNNGKVQVWDSYKFVAKSYYNETYHFKSLDTWLKGICESHCSEHRWKRRKYNPTKKSIFHVDSDQDLQQQDQPAGDDGNEDNFLVRGSTYCGASPDPKEKADRISETVDEEQETDDEMCDASPESDLEDVDENAENLEDNVEETLNHAAIKVKAVSSGIITAQAGGSFSVGLENRGLYIHNMIGQTNQEPVDRNSIHDSKQSDDGILVGELLTECDMCQKKLTDESLEGCGVSDNEMRDSKRNSISGMITVGNNQTAPDVQDDSNVGGNADALPAVLGAIVDLEDNVKKITLKDASVNVSQNALINQCKEEDTKKAEVKPEATPTLGKVPVMKSPVQDSRAENSGLRAENFRLRTESAGLAAESSGRSSADSLDEEPTSSRVDSRMNTMSNISLADSQYSERGAV